MAWESHKLRVARTIRAVPSLSLLSKRPAREVFQAVVDQLVSKERLPDREQLLNDLLSLMACHAAVRRGPTDQGRDCFPSGPASPGPGLAPLPQWPANLDPVQPA